MTDLGYWDGRAPWPASSARTSGWSGTGCICIVDDGVFEAVE